MIRKILFAVALFCTPPAFAELVHENADDSGVTDPSDASWRSYLEQMDRFPERLGFICYNAYILNKTPDHASARQFFLECARRGHAPSMINLALFYADGMGVDVDLSEAAYWLRRGAETGYPAAELEYAKVLLAGAGVTKNEMLGHFWLRRSAAHGDPDAQRMLQDMRLPTVAWIE
jgi:hypothetical protein